MPLELGLLQCLVAVALWALVHADLLSSQTVALQIGLLVVSLLAPQSPGRDEGVAWGCFLVPLLCAVCALLQADRSTQVYFVELADMAGVLSIATFWDGHLLVRALCIAIANPLRDRRVSFLVAGVYLTLMHRNSVRILATSLRLGEMMTVSHCIALMLLVVAMDHGKLVTSAFIIQAVLLVALAVTTTTLWASAVDSKFVGSARCYWLIVPVILVGLVLMDLKIPEVWARPHWLGAFPQTDLLARDREVCSGWQTWPSPPGRASPSRCIGLSFSPSLFSWFRERTSSSASFPIWTSGNIFIFSQSSSFILESFWSSSTRPWRWLQRLQHCWDWNA
eukprot:m.247397 g.247397  ORF g.247397 m.247397 type:complete len:336 (-) comp54479_c0_seq49:570-1577(-)